MSQNSESATLIPENGIVKVNMTGNTITTVVIN